MAMKLHGNVRVEVRVNFLALFASKPRIFMCGALKLSGIVRVNIAIAMLFVSLKKRFSLKEDKHATTNVQNRLTSFFSLSFVLFYYLFVSFTKTTCNFKETSWGKNS